MMRSPWHADWRRKKGFWWGFRREPTFGAAIEVAKRPENAGKTIVTIACSNRRTLPKHAAGGRSTRSSGGLERCRPVARGGQVSEISDNRLAKGSLLYKECSCARRILPLDISGIEGRLAVAGAQLLFVYPTQQLPKILNSLAFFLGSFWKAFVQLRTISEL
jgi:hypothetical protein